jgi:Zn-finger nucleic acid-binding protein
MAMTCPSCGGDLAELDRSGVKIDACRNCRGVWLDRGELDRILERERSARPEDDEDFIKEVTGGKRSQERYGFDRKAAERMYDDYRSHKHQKKRKKSLFEELFD